MNRFQQGTDELDVDMDLDDYDDHGDSSYNEEMSRAAVGRLFDKIDDNSASPPSAKPVRSAFVSGFDRAPARPEVREVRPEPRDLAQEDRRPSDKSKSRTAPKPILGLVDNNRDWDNQPSADSRPRRGRDDSYDSWDNEQPPSEKPHLAQATGKRPNLSQATGKRPPLSQATGRRPALSQATGKRPPISQATGKRPRVRQESMTARILQGDSQDDDSGYRDISRAARDRSDRERRRGLTPDVKPAVRVNVPTERPMRDSGQDADLQPRRSNRTDPEAPPPEGNIDDFRKRYNPGEMISSPRNPNRPVRAGQSRDVRKDRAKISSRDMETVSPLRWILAGAVLFVLILIVFLVVRVNALGRYRDDVVELRAELDALIATEAGVRAELYRANQQIEELEAIVNPTEQDPNGTPGSTPTPGPGQSNQTDLDFVLPLVHVVEPNQNLNMIARIYFPDAYVGEAIAHIQAVNDIRNPNHVQVGERLQITPMPMPGSEED